MSSGKIVQIIGAVIDVEFPRESVPQVYDALNVEGKPIVLEVQQSNSVMESFARSQWVPQKGYRGVRCY